MTELAASPAVPPSPRLGGAFRAAVSDFYFNSWRLVPANVVWAAGLIAILATVSTVSGLALLLLPVLALPTAGIYRVAALIVRGRSVSFADAFGAWRSHGAAALVLGLGFALGGAVLATNLATGLAGADTPGLILATAAFWGLVALSLLALTVWPLLVDPARDGEPVRGRLRLAGLLVLAHPGRMLLLGLVLAVVLALSAVAVVALLTIGVAFTALVACRYVLPASDRLEALLAGRSPG